MNCCQLNDIKKSWASTIALVGMIATYTIIIGTWSVNRFMSFNATLWDLGIMIQAIWNTSHGRILHESVNLGYSISRMAAAHWELIYLPLAVVYRIIPSVPLLLYIQSFVLACGVIPIYQFAVKKISSQTTALFIASAYLFYPALHGANLFDLHGLTFATTFLLLTFNYLDQENLPKTFIFAFISICCREDVAFSIFTLGLYGWLVKKNIKIGIPLLILSAVWIFAFFSRAHFAGHAELITKTNMAPIWGNLGLNDNLNFLKSPFKTIVIIIQFLGSYENIKYLTKLILPVIGLCFLSPKILFIASLTLLLNLLSNWDQMHQIEYHYTATITPFIFLATIAGMANLKTWLARFTIFNSDRIPIVCSLVILFSAIFSTTQFSILRFHKTWQVSENQKKLASSLKEIPNDLSVSTTARAGTHLANRIRLYHFPEHASSADIVIIELNRPMVEVKNLKNKLRTLKIPAMNEITASIFQDTTLGLRFVEDNVFCFQRGLNSLSGFKSYAFQNELPSDAIKIEKIGLVNGLHFLGWKPIYSGDKQAHLQLFWYTEKKQPIGMALSFYLKSGELKIEIPYQPVFGSVPISEWEPGKIVCDHLFINRPEPKAITTFSVIVSISDASKSLEQRLFEFRFP